MQREREQLQARLEQIDSLNLSKQEMQVLVQDTIRFLAGFEYTLREGVPEEKRAALRRRAIYRIPGLPAGQRAVETRSRSIDPEKGPAGNGQEERQR